MTTILYVQTCDAFEYIYADFQLVISYYGQKLVTWMLKEVNVWVEHGSLP